MNTILFFFDITLLFIIFFCLKKYDWSMLNPLFFLSCYHIIFVTFRFFIFFFNEDSVLKFIPINVEVNRASLLKSFFLEICSLFLFSIAHFLVMKLKINNSNSRTITEFSLLGKIFFIISLLAFICFTSFFGYVLIGYNLESSILGTFIISIEYWLLLFLIISISIKKFKSKYLIYLTFFLIIVQALEGYGRWRLLLSSLFLLTSFLTINGILMPKIRFHHIFVILFSIILISNLKYLGLFFFVINENGVVLPNISDMISSTPVVVLFGDLFITDHQSALIYSFDNSSFGNLYGKTYLNNFEIFFPKYFFPNKTSTNSYLQELPINSELFKINGNIATLLGESYANFNFFAPLVFFVFGIFITLIYKNARTDIKNKFFSNSYLMYLCFYLSLFQILRDGSSSLITFTLMSLFPLLFSSFLFKQTIFKYNSSNLTDLN